MRTTAIISILLLSAAALCSCSSNPKSATTSQWRGENRDGVYHETGLLKSWPENGPELLWHYAELGQGHTSASIADDKLYVTGMTDSTGYLYVFDLQGKLLNKKAYGLEWSANFHGSRSSVNVNDGRLYIFTGRGVLLCWDEKTLEPVWSKNMLTDFDGRNLRFGMTESPLIVGDVIYMTPGGKVNGVVALNKKTGDLIWSSPGIGKLSSYCSPQYIGDKKTPVVVNAVDSCLIGLDANTGELLWAEVQKNPHSMNPNTPIYADGKLFSTTGGDIGAMLLRVAEDGKSVEKIWSHEMDNKMGGAVKVGDYVYGSGERKRYWYCIDWKTGETKYKDNQLGVGVVIAADGMLYCYSDKGEMALVRATPEKFDLVSKFNITLGTEQHWAHPVIHSGVLYVRHGNTLMAYKVK
jgi:outer membrane protein assembly factor BamB